MNEVDVEICESEVICSAGPQLLQPAVTIDPTVDVSEPFTTTLGIPISPQSLSLEGTGGFFLNEGGNGTMLLLVTARHIVFPHK